MRSQKRRMQRPKFVRGDDPRITWLMQCANQMFIRCGYMLATHTETGLISLSELQVADLDRFEEAHQGTTPLGTVYVWDDEDAQAFEYFEP